MNFDWTKPVVIDWSGRSGPLITEHDVKNSVIKRILHNQYCAPFCERPNIRVKPWWNPQDPLGAKPEPKPSTPWKNDQFIPGLHKSNYPQLSNLSKLQHMQGLRVLNAKCENVQPIYFSQPNQSDYTAFEEMEELYKAEQIEFVKWAKILWINGDCIRALRPKPILEKVYEAEFKMRLHEIKSLPSNYAWAAQIPLEMKNDIFELEHKEDLINVDVQDLPLIEYPEQLEKAYSILMKSCPVPEPCPEHPCKFVLPNEETVSVLPLTEIHRELANYAIENGSEFIASESALRCLLQTDQSWKVPVSVVEVRDPENGDLKTVVVLGSEFDIQKECSKQRTYKAYKHLLRHTFAPSTGHYKSKKSTKQTANTINTSPQKTLNPTDTKEQVAPRHNRFVSLDDDLEVSSDENDSDNLLIDDNEPNYEPIPLKNRCKSGRILNEHTDREIDKFGREPNNAPDRLLTDIGNYGLDFYEPETSSDAYNLIPSYSHDGPNKEFDRLIVDDSKKVITEPIDFYEPNYSINAKEARPSYSHNRDKPDSEPDQLIIEDASKANQEPSCYPDFYEPDYSNNSRPSYSHNSDKPDSEPDQLNIQDASKANQEPSCYPDFYEPDYSNNSRPSYSHNSDKPDSEPDQLNIQDASKANQEPSCYPDFYEPDYSNNPKPSYSHNRDEPDNQPGQIIINDATKANQEPSCNLDIYKPDYSNNPKPSYSHNRDEPDNEPGQLILEDASKTGQEPSCNLDIYKPDYSNNPKPSYSNDKSSSSPDRPSIIVKPEPGDNFCEPKSRPSHDSPDRLVQNDDNKPKHELDFNFDSCEPIYKNDTSDSYVSEPDNVNNEPLLINKENPDARNPFLRFTESDEATTESNLDYLPSLLNINEDAPDSNVDGISSVFAMHKDSSESNLDAAPKLAETNKDNSVSNIDNAPSTIETNEDNSVSNIDTAPNIIGTNDDNSEPSVDSTQSFLEINEGNSETNVGDTKEHAASSLFETNEEAVPHFEINENCSEANIDAALCKLKTDEDSSEWNVGAASDTNDNTSESFVDAGPSLVKTNKHTLEFNVNAIPSLFETLEDTFDLNLDANEGSFVKNEDAVTSVCKIEPDASNTNVEAAERSVENLGTKIKPTHKNIYSKKSTTTGVTSNVSNNTTDLSKTDKPHRISVSNRSLFDTKAYVCSVKNPIKRSYCETNIDDSNTPSSEISKAPTRLGISEIITRNPASLTSNITENNKPTTTTTKVRSSKPARRRSVRISNAKEREREVMKVSEIITSKASVINVKKEVVECNTNMTELSPVKPSVNETKKNVAGETTEKPIEIPKPITRKRSISSVNTEIAKVVESTCKGIDAGLKPNIREPSVSGTTEEADVYESNIKKIRKLSEQIFREHDYCHFRAESPKTTLPEPRKISITQFEHDYRNPSDSTLCFEKSNSNHSNRDTVPISLTIDDIVSIPDKPDAIKLKLNSPIAIETENPSYNEPKPDIGNVASTNPTSMPVKTLPEKINISELFGDESDSDVPIYNTSYRKKNFKDIRAANDLSDTRHKNEPSHSILESQTITELITKPDSRKLSIEGVSIEKNPLKPCLKKSYSESPRNSKRTLSFSDPLTSDPELNVSVSETDSEEPIAGFHNGVAIPSTSLPKNPKKRKNTVTVPYGRRSKKKPKIKVAKKSKSSDNNKEKNGFTKLPPPLTRYNPRNVAQKRISCSDSDDVEFRVSTISNAKNDTKKNKTVNVALRRSRRISARVNTESDEAHTNKTNVNYTSESSEGLRRSRRISDRSITKEKTQPKTNTCLNTSSSFTKINKKDQNRRKSLPANIFSKTVKTNLSVLRSKSFPNLTEFSKTNSRYETKTRNKKVPKKKDMSNSLKLSERTKRYLRRVFSFDSSETDQSDEEMSDCTQRYIRRSKFSACSGAEQSSTEIKKRTKRYKRSSAQYARQTGNNSKTGASTINNEDKLTERTNRHNRRSNTAEYSSCDETIQPILIRRKKTKRQPREDNTIDSSTNQIDSSSAMEANEEQPETEEMDIENAMSTIEPKYEFNMETIEIDVCEEIDESIVKTEINVLHFTELRVNQMNICEDNLSCSDDQNSLGSTNHLQNMIVTEEEELNPFHLTTNEMHVSDSDAEFYDSITHNSPNASSREANYESIAVDKPQINNKLIQTKLDIDDTYAILTTINEIKSKTDSISDDSNSSDYFDMEETEELNMFHFTATNDSDSDESPQEDFLIVDDSQTDTVPVNTFVEIDNNQTAEEQYPTQESLCDETMHTDELKAQHCKPIYGSYDTSYINEPVPSHSKVETKFDFDVERTLNKTDNTKDLNLGKSLSEDLCYQNEMLYTSAMTKENMNDIIGVYNCTCKGTLFEVPPPRSFKKWRLRNKCSNFGFDMIVHSSHKAKKDDSEMLLEPIVEYQPELGGCKQSAGRIRALALSLMLRQTAGLINVRVDHENGDVIVVDKMTHDKFISKYGDKRDEVSNTLHTTLNQLRFLKPGQYVMAHDSSHGLNAMIYSAKGAHACASENPLNLHQDNINMNDADDAIFAKVPPVLDSVLLPFHKYRSVLPLAFTPNKSQVKDNKKMATALAKAKLPPQAIQWPKKKKKSKKPRVPRQDPSVQLEE